MACLTAVYLSFYYHRENKKRDAEERAHDDEELENEKQRPMEEVPTNLRDLAPAFRYYI